MAVDAVTSNRWRQEQPETGFNPQIMAKRPSPPRNSTSQQVCDAVTAAWGAAGQAGDLNLPTTVEVATPNVADQIGGCTATSPAATASS